MKERYGELKHHLYQKNSQWKKDGVSVIDERDWVIDEMFKLLSFFVEKELELDKLNEKLNSELGWE